jgi:hypothetical protein
MTTIYHLPADRHEDDFGQPILRTKGEELYDAPTVHGCWATMTAASWKHHRASSRLGTGRGQRYVYDGEHFVKTGG